MNFEFTKYLFNCIPIFELPVNDKQSISKFLIIYLDIFFGLLVIINFIKFLLSPQSVNIFIILIEDKGVFSDGLNTIGTSAITAGKILCIDKTKGKLKGVIANNELNGSSIILIVGSFFFFNQKF